MGNFMYMSFRGPQHGFEETEGAHCSKIFLKFSFRKYYMKWFQIKKSLIIKVENFVAEPEPIAVAAAAPAPAPFYLPQT